MTEVVLTVPARVHISLLDMSAAGYRRHGGIGFALSNGYSCRSKVNSSIRITDRRPSSTANERQCEQLHQLLLDALISTPGLAPIEMIIEKGFDAHSGFGSGTALRLAAIESLFSLNGMRPSNEEIIKLSGRGGVSGIGVNTYFSGGFWLDCGIKNGLTQGFFRSDDQGCVNTLPTALARIDMPEEWIFGLCVPVTPVEMSNDEKNFFSSFNSPPIEQIWRLVYEAVFGVVPSIVEADRLTFGLSLERIQSCYWKAAERSYHATWLQMVTKNIKALGGGDVYMSSFGPGVFFLPKRPMVDVTIEGAVIGWCRADNIGRVLKYA